MKAPAVASYFDQVRSASVPLLAKFGIATLASSSVLSLTGFLFTTLSKQSAQLLSVSLASAMLAVGTTLFAVRKRGLVNLLPEPLEKPLLEDSVLEVYQEMGRRFDLQKFLDQCAELGPFLIALTEEEQNECVDNMGSAMQHMFRSKGLITLLPGEAQQLLLPAGVEPRLAPAVETRPNLARQNQLLIRLVKTRCFEMLETMENHYPVVRGLVVVYGKVEQFVHFLRVQSGNDTQVALIMSVFLVFLLRIVFVIVSLVLRKFFGIFYL
ncbi:hypothetical protein BASA81_000522 [Batrachochytrium salamandrivorans]|nr:hypothetical protein BASA81_000522 [Batrachochytrium salamandrivorans]